MDTLDGNTLTLERPTFAGIVNSLDQSEGIQERTTAMVGSLSSENNRKFVINAVKKHISSPVLIEIFEKHPTLWMHLIRIIHANLKADVSEGTFSIPKEKHWKVKSLFLIRDRESDIGEYVNQQYQKGIEESILENQEFLEFCANQPSPLDIGTDVFDRLHPDKYESTIRGLILRGMIDNVEGCTFENINEHFPRISKKIARYLPLVFNVDMDSYREFERINNFDDLIKLIMSNLNQRMYTNYAARRIHVLRYIKAFHAWGDIESIEQAQQNAEEYAKPENMKELFQRKGKLKITDIVAFEEDGITQYKGKIHIKGEVYEIRWRAKSLKSILTKLWEIEEYTNKDAMRDMLGISIIPPDEVSEKSIIDIVDSISQIMPNYGYLIKSKGLIPNYKPKASSKKPSPLAITSEVEDKNNPNFNNVSVGGYVKLDKMNNACGIEVQVIKASNFAWKKMDDYYYKVVGFLDLICRGENYISPGQLISTLDNTVSTIKLGQISVALSEAEGRDINFSSIQDLIIHLIKGKKLFIYQSRRNEILCIPKKYQRKFEQSRSTWKKLTQSEFPAIESFFRELHLDY